MFLGRDKVRARPASGGRQTQMPPPLSPAEQVPKDLVEQLCAFGEDPGSIGSVWCGAGGWYARVLTPRPRVPLPASQSKGRTQATATKLSVPKPVNLPSMKKVQPQSPSSKGKGAECFCFFFFFFFFMAAGRTRVARVALRERRVVSVVPNPRALRADAPRCTTPSRSHQEHAGNDPNAQLVPTAHPGGWHVGEDGGPSSQGDAAASTALADAARQALSAGGCRHARRH